MTPSDGEPAVRSPCGADVLTLPATPTRRRAGLLPAFSEYPAFRLLWVSNLFFFGGVWTQTLILGWLVYDLTGSEFLLALFTAARLGPMMLGPISGVIADRFHRVRFMLVTVAWAFASVCALAVLVSAHIATYWEIVVGGFCIGLAQSPSQPARFSLVSTIVSRSHLSGANALNSMALNVTQVVGPGLGGAMISIFGVSTALWVSALWYPISFIALWPLRHALENEPHDGESVVRQLVTGVRIVLSDRLMASVLFVSLVANICIWPVYQAFMPVFAKSILGLGPSGLGWLLTTCGIGALAGSLAIALLGDFPNKGALFVAGTAIWGGLWALFALTRSIPFAFAVMAAAGVASSAFAVLQSTLLLALAPLHVRGRAMGLQEMAIGVLPVATVVHGVVAGYLGVATSTALSGSLLAVSMVWLAVRVPSLLRYR